MRILVLGGSYTGRVLASRFAGRHQVFFLTRRPDALRREGFRVLEPVRVPADFDLVVDTVPAIPFGETIEPPPYWETVDALLRARSAMALVHISSTSVYGPSAGQAAIDERTDPRPELRRGRLRLQLERAWIKRFPQVRIIRSAGIYGPGRCVLLKLRDGDEKRLAIGNRFVSRIHVEDLCRLAIALSPATAPSLVNGVDLAPVPYAEVLCYCEGFLGRRLPGDWRGQTPRGRRIHSLYAKGLLGEYRYPTYREGFPACLVESQSSQWRGEGSLKGSSPNEA